MGRTSDANERLMQATLDLMWEESYGAITIDDICKRAKVKKGSFYYFFESKAELTMAALDWLWLSEWKPRLDACFSPSVDPLVRITDYLETAYPKHVEIKCRCGKVLGCPLFSVASEVSTAQDKLSAKVRDIFSRKRRYFESAIRDAVAQGSIEPCDPVQKSHSLSALIEGIISQARIMNDPELIKPLPAMALDLLRERKPVLSRS